MKSISCPNCRTKIKETIPFDLDSNDLWGEKELVEMIDNELSSLTDQELEYICLKEGLKRLADAQSDNKTRWQLIQIKELDGNSALMKLPADMLCSDIKRILSATYNMSPPQVRLIIQGCPVSDALRLCEYAKDLNTPITIHLVTQCTGS
jgi:hypothetical protein